MAKRKLFVNLAVKDLKRSMAFFKQLGFTFNMQFTDDRAACMIVSEQASVMLLTREMFKTFTKRELCDTRTCSEGLFALSCESRAEVDALVDSALSMGASRAMPAADHGFMYACSFYDLDNHHWEVLWMDPKQLQS